MLSGTNGSAMSSLNFHSRPLERRVAHCVNHSVEQVRFLWRGFRAEATTVLPPRITWSVRYLVYLNNRPSESAS